MALFGKKTQTKTTAAGQRPAAKEAAPAKPSMQELYGAPTAKTAAGKEARIKVKPDSQAYRVLVKPLITEKTTHLNSQSKYVFVIAADTNKIEVAKAVSQLYGVKPLKVNIIKMEGKIKTRGRVSGKRKDWKKAIVTLPAGKTIDVYEGV